MASVAMRRLASGNGSALRRPLGSAVSCVRRSFDTSTEMARVDRSDSRRDSPPSAFFSDVSRGRGGGGGGWDVREDEDALRLKVDMPGLGKEVVEVSMEYNTLIIKGEKDGDNRRRYSDRIPLTPNMYQINGIKAEMKNGVLKLTVPKLQVDNKHVVKVAVH